LLTINLDEYNIGNYNLNTIPLYVVCIRIELVA
jgi:hypothetical protein